jgi:hypothetical protein
MSFDLEIPDIPRHLPPMPFDRLSRNDNFPRPANDNWSLTALTAANDNRPDVLAHMDDILRESRRLARRSGKTLKKAERAVGAAYLASHR